MTGPDGRWMAYGTRFRPSDRLESPTADEARARAVELHVAAGCPRGAEYVVNGWLFRGDDL